MITIVIIIKPPYLTQQIPEWKKKRLEIKRINNEQALQRQVNKKNYEIITRINKDSNMNWCTASDTNTFNINVEKGNRVKSWGVGGGWEQQT